MIVIESKRKKIENILKSYPDAVIHDVTSHAVDDFIRFSPFYPHGGIPVPFSPGYTAASVESIWQGLKDYDSVGIDTSVFQNRTMKDLKRTVRKYGRMKGHRRGVRGTDHLEYVEARKAIYAPSYKWVLENKVSILVEKLKRESEKGTIVLLDYNTNEDINDSSSPLSHASLIKAYIEGRYPVSEYETSSTLPDSQEAAPVTPSFSVGDSVNHPTFGDGIVKSINSSTMIIEFGSVGEKEISLMYKRLCIIM